MSLTPYNSQHSQSHDSDNPQMKRAGFSLIEVMISMSILVFISFGIYQATVETYRLRDVLGAEGSFYNTIRLAMSIFERDVALFYSPIRLLPAQQVRDARVQTPLIPSLPGEDLQIPYQFWSPAIDASGIRPSRVVGADNKLSFISTSYTRIYRDSPGSEFAKVSYELRPDPQVAQDPELKNTFILVKTESTNAFSRDERKDPLSQSHELLHGVKKFQLTYLIKEGNTWRTLKSWDSDLDPPRFTFPDMIVVDLEVVGAKRLSFEGKYKMRPEIPLNGLPANF